VVSLNGLLKIVFGQMEKNRNLELEKKVAQTFMENALELRELKQKQKPQTFVDQETQTESSFGIVEDIQHGLASLKREEFAVVWGEITRMKKQKEGCLPIEDNCKSKFANERASQILAAAIFIFSVKGRNDTWMDIVNGFHYTFEKRKEGQQIWEELVKRRFDNLFQLTHQEVTVMLSF
jgi:hypothetical protein